MPTFFTKCILVLFMWIIKDSWGIQNVKLILPAIVQAGTSATLLCLYDLEGASLYSVQWYRGQFEFFRYVPNENPPDKVFEIPGFHVDTSASNDHQVTLRNISVQISGEFSCEITTDAPPFSTSCVSNNLTVIDFHLSIKIPEKQYYFGDVLEANCTLRPRHPTAEIMFYWNAKPITKKFIKKQLVNIGYLHLNTTVFDEGLPFPVLVQLRCSTLLGDSQLIFSKTVNLEIRPNPARNSVAVKLINIYLLIFAFGLTYGFINEKS